MPGQKHQFPEIDYFLKAYLRERPLFLSLIRAKEAQLYQKYLPLRRLVLDVGCGDGFFAKVTISHHDSKALKTRSASWPNGLPRGGGNSNAYLIDVGLDIKNSRIKEARKLGVYKKIVTYDGKMIPFPDNYFSTVVSNCVLEHVEDLDQLTSEIYRVLEGRGLFLTTVVAQNWEEYLLGNLLLGNFYKKWMRKKQVHHNMNTSSQWRKVFKKHGLKIEKEIGYLDKIAVKAIDFFHYLSVSSLISYKLFGRWVIWQDKLFLFPVKFLSRLISPNLDSNKSGCIFFVLRK